MAKEKWEFLLKFSWNSHKNWSISWSDKIQLIAYAYFLEITDHINFNNKILKIIRKYSEEMTTGGPNIHAARLSAGEVSVICRLRSYLCAHCSICGVPMLALSFKTVPKPKQISKTWKRLFSLPWTALLTHEHPSECLLKRWGQGRHFPSLSRLSQWVTQHQLCWNLAPNAIYQHKGADGIIYR